MEENVKAAEIEAGVDLGVPEGEQATACVILTEEALKAMLQEAAKTAIKELKREETKERKRNKYHDTFSLMKCYRDAVFHIENAVTSRKSNMGLPSILITVMAIQKRTIIPATPI